MIYWLTPWQPSLALMVITIIVVAMYIRDCGRLHPSFSRQLSFWLGLSLLYISCNTRADYYFAQGFFLHRIQHSILHHIGPFLIALSRSGAALAAGTPKSWRKEISLWLDLKPIRYVIDILNHPFLAAFLFCGLILLWLIPSVHFIAMLDARWYRVMNWGMAINGLMFWNLALNNFCLRPAHLSPITRITMMLAIIPPQIIIGMLIFAAPHELYLNYVICGRTLGITPMADQQIGGLILWIPAAMMSIIGMLMVIGREWIQQKIIPVAS